MNRYRRNDKAVSPVIATILMVAITVVLAGVLVVYLQSLPTSSGPVEMKLGVSAKMENGNWTISVSSGSQNAADVTLMVKSGGAAVWATNPKVNAIPAADGVFNDNNANGKLDAADTVILYDTATVSAGMEVQFLKGGDIVGTIGSLPS